MLDQRIRQAILTLREAGHGTRAIAHALKISCGAVKDVLAAGTAAPPALARAEKAEPHRTAPLPEQRELAAAGAPFAEYAVTLKKRIGSRWPIALRRLAQLRRDYPAAPLIAAIETAAHYGLYDLDRLERMILRNVATAYFVLPADREGPDPEPSDEG